MILFNNKDSVLDENSFSYGRGIEKRTVYIQHILDYDGNPFTFKIFQNEFEIIIQLPCYASEHIYLRVE